MIQERVARVKDHKEVIEDTEMTIESQTEDHTEVKNLTSHKDKNQNYSYMVINKIFRKIP